MQSGISSRRCCGIICIGRSRVYHRQIFLANGCRIAELDLLARLQNKVLVMVICITQAQFVYRKRNRESIVAVGLQICKRFPARIAVGVTVGIGHLSAAVIAGHSCGSIRQIQLNISQILLVAVSIQETQMKIGYAVADLIRIVQSRSKIFRHLIIDHRVDESALLACLTAALQCCQVVFQCHLLPDGFARTIACFLCRILLIQCSGRFLCGKGLGMERCNGIFPIDRMGQFFSVCRLDRMGCGCSIRSNCASGFGHSNRLDIFAVNMGIGVHCGEMLRISVCFLCSAVCQILVSSHTGHLDIFQRDLALCRAAELGVGRASLQIIVDPAYPNYIRQIGICHSCLCQLPCFAGCVGIGFPGDLYFIVFVCLEGDVLIFCKARVCAGCCNRIEHFYLAELVGFKWNGIRFCQFKAAVILDAAVLRFLFQERNIYRIGVAVVSGLLIQTANGQRCALSVIILLRVIRLIGQCDRSSRLILQSTLHMGIILRLRCRILLRIAVIVEIACQICSAGCIRTGVVWLIVSAAGSVIDRILRISMLLCSVHLYIYCADRHIIIASAVFGELCRHTEVNRFARVDLIVKQCALAQFSRQTAVSRFFRIAVCLVQQRVLYTLCCCNLCAAVGQFRGDIRRRNIRRCILCRQNLAACIHYIPPNNTLSLGN